MLVQPTPTVEMEFHRPGRRPAAPPSADVRQWTTATDSGPSAARLTSSPRTRSAVLGALLAFAFVAAHLVNPYRDHWLPSCPFHAMTGLWCPACGSTRAACALAHGNPLSALRHNAAFLAVLTLLVWTWVAYAIRAFAPRSAGSPWLSGPIRLLRRPWWIVGLVGAFWILRNVPGAAEHLLSR